MINTIIKILLFVLFVGLLLFIGYWAGTKGFLRNKTGGESVETGKTSPSKQKEKTSGDKEDAQPPSEEKSEQKEGGGDQTQEPKKTENENDSAQTKKSKIPHAHRLSYTISTKAYLVRQEAVKLVRQLAMKGYSAYILSIWDNQKKLWYSVRMGHYLSYDTALKEAEKFSLAARIPAKVLAVGSLEQLPPELFEKKSKPAEPKPPSSKKQSS